MRAARHHRQSAFTIVEVMMAAVVLVVGFMGMIQAVTMGSEMLATARRTNAAGQIINHELEQMRLESWTTLQALSTTTTWSSGTAYTVGTTATYNGGWYTCVTANTGHTPTEAAFWAPYMTWSSSVAYKRMNLVRYNNAWYRCITANTGQTPTSTAYWTPYVGAIGSTGVMDGVTFSITCEVADVTTDLREISFIVSWTKGGTTAAASTPTGSWLSRLAFYRESPVARTYTRKGVGYYGKYGLNLSAQRS